MAQANGSSNMAGTAGNILLAVGILIYFSGTAGAPRTFVFIGAALLILSIAAFLVEELSAKAH